MALIEFAIKIYFHGLINVIAASQSGDFEQIHLRTVPNIVTAHTFCASPDTGISYRQCLPIQGYFCAV